MSPVAELEYLRKISELYILFLLPRSYSLSPVKFLLREVLACKSMYLLFTKNICTHGLLHIYLFFYSVFFSFETSDRFNHGS